MQSGRSENTSIRRRREQSGSVPLQRQAAPRTDTSNQFQMLLFPSSLHPLVGWLERVGDSPSTFLLAWLLAPCSVQHADGLIPADFVLRAF